MRILATLVSTILLAAAQANATTAVLSGTVKDVTSYDSVSNPSVSDYITVNVVGTGGTTCHTTGGRVILMVRDDDRGKRMIAIATAALLSGKTVSVSIDDTKVIATNYCALQYITITN
jgi:hypothetical protein